MFPLSSTKKVKNFCCGDQLHCVLQSPHPSFSEEHLQARTANRTKGAIYIGVTAGAAPSGRIEIKGKQRAHDFSSNLRKTLIQHLVKTLAHKTIRKHHAISTRKIAQHSRTFLAKETLAHLIPKEVRLLTWKSTTSRRASLAIRVLLEQEAREFVVFSHTRKPLETFFERSTGQRPSNPSHSRFVNDDVQSSKSQG